MSFTIGRPRVLFPSLAFALVLAGCNPQQQGELSANVAAPNIDVAAVPGTPSAAAAATAQEPDKIDVAENGVPLPPLRPDFEKLAREKSQQPGTAVAAAPAAPGTSPAAARSPKSGVSAYAQTAAALPVAQRPTGIFSIFAGAPADPAAPVQVAAVAPATASDAPAAERASFNAYERRMSGEDLVTAAKPAQTGGSSAFQVTPAAVVEVAGVTREVPGSSRTSSMPTLVGPSPQISGTFGMGGQNWRPAYDHVVTNCFGPDLRAALENIARHFNSEVLVTSGHRTNGRRKSMHRFCRAADIRVVGVSPGTVARYAANVPGINGVGTYRRVALTHIDTRENLMAWRH